VPRDSCNIHQHTGINIRIGRSATYKVWLSFLACLSDLKGLDNVPCERLITMEHTEKTTAQAPVLDVKDANTRNRGNTLAMERASIVGALICWSGATKIW
jgi:hypothetical protein